MKKSLKIISAFAAVAFMAVSCGVVSFTGRKQMLLYSDSEIMALSDESYAEFMTTAEVSKDAEATKTLVNVGEKMVSALESYMQAHNMSSALSGLTWEFQLVKSEEVNAFCMPSGKIVFYEGIMKLADNPDYIAVVMGHEMAHAIAKHGNERMSQESAANLVGSVASELVGLKSNSTTQTLFNAAFGLGMQAGVLLPYSRKHEYEADKIGVYIMQLAGYDINAAPEFWEKMLGEGDPNASDFFSTHPSDAKRIAALKKVINDMPEL